MRFFLHMTENILGVKIQKLFAKKKEQKICFRIKNCCNLKLPQTVPQDVYDRKCCIQTLETNFSML